MVSRSERAPATGRWSMPTEIRRWRSKSLLGATAYNQRSVAETAMYRVKQLFGVHLASRDYDAQVGETMAMIRALNIMTRVGMPESVRID